jgi:hypothetical protein
VPSSWFLQLLLSILKTEILILTRSISRSIKIQSSLFFFVLLLFSNKFDLSVLRLRLLCFLIIAFTY